MDPVNYQYHVAAGYLLFPVRVTVFLMSFVPGLLTLSIVQKLGFTRLSTSICNAYVSFYRWLGGLTLHIEGKEHIVENACVVANHINLYDHFVIATTLGYILPYVVSTKFNVSPINIICDTIKCIYTGGEKGSTVEQIRKRIKGGSGLIIYPDACNTIPEGDLIAPFKSGAFVPKAPILPIVIRYVPSSTTNMNWYSEKESKGQYKQNTILSLLTSYLLDGDIHVYVKVLPLQEYKSSYKSHDEYKEDIHELMSQALATLPKQTPTVMVGEPSTALTMKYIMYLLYYALFSYCIGNTLGACLLCMNVIATYFCHFYPTVNTRLLDTLMVCYVTTKTLSLSIQGQYDLYIRYLYGLFMLTRGYRYLHYKDDKPFGELKHLRNIWIPGYAFSVYPFILNTLELYNLI